MRRRAALLLALLLGTAVSLKAAPDLSDDAILRDSLWKQLVSKPKGERPTVGVVLSAGSLRATAHIGVLSVLVDAGFPIDLMAGTSMGAVIGSLFAAGDSISRLRDMATHVRVNTGNNLNAFTFLRYILFSKLLSSARAAKFINQEVGGRTFEQLKIPFACVAMDLYSGEAIVFREGPLAPAVRASMNLPGIFQPVEYRQRYLVDGGVVDYIPIDAARLLGADWVLASVTETDYTQSKPRSVIESLEQVIDIRGSLLSREEKRAANFVIEPPVGGIGMAESDRIPEAIKKGTIAADRALNPAMESLILFSMPSLASDYLPKEASR